MTTFGQAMFIESHRRNDCCDFCKEESRCAHCPDRCKSDDEDKNRCQSCLLCVEFTQGNGEKPYKADLSEWKRLFRIKKKEAA